MRAEKTKECPSCAMEIDKKLKKCPVCDHEFYEAGWVIKLVAVILILLFVLMFLI